MIKFKCSCGTAYDADADRAGTEFDCPKCGATLKVPSLPALRPLPSNNRKKTSLEESDEEILFTSAPRSSTKETRRSAEAKSEFCFFCLTGRSIWIMGYIMILAAMSFHSISYNVRSGEYDFNPAYAVAKQTLFTLSCGLMIIGTILRCRSTVAAGVFEAILLIIAVFCITIVPISLPWIYWYMNYQPAV